MRGKINGLKLTIDLLPKGAWGNDLSERLSKKDWDKLRNFAYEKSNYRCAVCGKSGVALEAHEIWEFDISHKTQTLNDIVALCPACHGVKHFRNSERIGYGASAKAHFLKTNGCDAMTLANHYARALVLFEKRNEVLRWKTVVDLRKLGGEGIAWKERYLPMIKNPYENVDFGDTEATAKLFRTERIRRVPEGSAPLSPKIRAVRVDPYQAEIAVVADFADCVRWYAGERKLKTNYNVVGQMTAKFRAEISANRSSGSKRSGATPPSGLCRSRYKLPVTRKTQRRPIDANDVFHRRPPLEKKNAVRQDRNAAEPDTVTNLPPFP